MRRFPGLSQASQPDAETAGSPRPATIPVLVVTGPVGVGKTAVGTAVGELAGQRGIGYGLIDLDQLRYAYPRPDDDPFHERLGLANLAAIWPNYQAAGAQCLILPAVVENHERVADIAAAVPGSAVLVVRLHAPLIVIRERLQEREHGTELTWHLQRTSELIDVYERTQPENLLIDAETRTVTDIAQEVLAAWLPADQ